MTSIPFWLTVEHECSYLEDRQAQSVVVEPDFKLNTLLYSRLIEQGFRRSGDQVYKPYCRNCQACIATRVPVSRFQPDRRQKRCEKRNKNTQVVVKEAVFYQRHFDLYQRYQVGRHGKDHTDITPKEYMQFLGSTWCDTLFVEFSIDDTLAAIAVVDVLDNALSAVYTFFEPKFSGYSPGVFAVLWEIEQARQRNLDYLYLGFWIKDCRKMQYKSQYQPLSGLIGQQWRPISDQL